MAVPIMPTGHTIHASSYSVFVAPQLSHSRHLVTDDLNRDDRTAASVCGGGRKIRRFVWHD